METQADQATFRRYLFFWSGQLASLLGSSIAQFVIIWWITLETESALYLSLASFLGFTPMVILAPFAGVLVDRWSRKTLILVMDFLQALAALALVLLFWQGIAFIWYVLALLTLRGVFQAFHAPAVSAIIPLMVPKERLSRINGLNYLCTGVITLLGPVVAALLLGFWQIHQILWIDVATFVLALIPLVMIAIPSVRRELEKTSFKEDFLEGFNFIKNARGLLPLLILATALNFLLTPLSTLLPYYVAFDHLGNAPDLALVLAFLQGGILAGGVLMTVTAGFKKKILAAAASIYVIFIGYILVALTPTGLFWFMAMAMLIMASCIPIANVSTTTMFQTVVPMKMQGRANAVVMAVASAATPLGMIVSGPVVEFTQTANLFLGCAIAGLLVLTVAWFLTDIKHVEQLEDQTTQTQSLPSPTPEPK